MKQLIPLLVMFALYSCEEKDQVKIKNLISLESEWSEEGFKTPPHSAKTQVWYHWLNGHLIKEGITKDLEDMKSMGIGGFRVFNAAEGTPPGSATYYSDEWWDMFIHTKNEAKRLDLEMCVMNGPGWATSGGPWNTPENAMQEVVWTEKKSPDRQNLKGNLASLNQYWAWSVI